MRTLLVFWLVFNIVCIAQVNPVTLAELLDKKAEDVDTKTVVTEILQRGHSIKASSEQLSKWGFDQEIIEAIYPSEITLLKRRLEKLEDIVKKQQKQLDELQNLMQQDNNIAPQETQNEVEEVSTSKNPEQVVTEEKSDSLSGFEYLGEKLYKCDEVQFTIKEYQHKKTGILFSLLPGGEFTMGSEDGRDRAKPMHKVVIQPFLMAKHEVTQEVWEKFMRYNPSSVRDPKNPVDTVTWNEAKKFCDNLGFQLPSEAQWEYACRAGTQTEYFWGAKMDREYGWFWANSANHVGLKKPNAFGLYDILGNVYEWCEDSWSPDYEKSPRDGSAWKNDSSQKVTRGAGISSYGNYCGSACRFWSYAYDKKPILGFRVVYLLK